MPASTYHYHAHRSPGPDRWEPTKQMLIEVFDSARGRYGYRRIKTVLARQHGVGLSGKTVLKLMHSTGRHCQIRARRYASYRGPVGTVAANVLEREFTAAAPNQKWVTAITEFRVAGEKVYLSAMLDLFDQQIIAYRAGPTPSMAQALDTLRAAITGLGPGQRPLVHSDQGWQYQQHSWIRLLTEHGLTQSMSRKATCLDNAVMENFFAPPQRGVLPTRGLCLHRGLPDPAGRLHRVVQHGAHQRKIGGTQPGAIPSQVPPMQLTAPKPHSNFRGSVHRSVRGLRRGPIRGPARSTSRPATR